jgi:hypothetical protein
MSRLLVFVSLLLLTAAGCRQAPPPEPTDRVNKLLMEQFDREPHNRMGAYPSPTIATRFLDPNNLGPHHYEFSLSEKNGIVFTCRAGHIDIFHVREAADWTAFLAAKTFQHLNNGDTAFSFKLKEGSIGLIQLTYPAAWLRLAPQEKHRLASLVAVRLGQYLGYTVGTWHEIVTWYGYKSRGFYPEFPSAFSWEDNFSNLLGSDIGAAALLDTEHPYDQAVTLALSNELEKLDAQPHEVAEQADQDVKGIWFSGSIPGMLDMKKRNFDIGVDDGFVTPSVVPDICQCKGVQPQSRPAPTLDSLARYGFSARFEIQPREWESKKVLSIIYPDEQTKGKSIEPAKHFAVIMSHIIGQAEKMYGPHIAHLSDY